MNSDSEQCRIHEHFAKSEEDRIREDQIHEALAEYEQECFIDLAERTVDADGMIQQLFKEHWDGDTLSFGKDLTEFLKKYQNYFEEYLKRETIHHHCFDPEFLAKRIQYRLLNFIKKQN